MARAFACEIAHFRLKVSGKAWIYPSEARRFAKVIAKILAGEIVLEKIGRAWQPVECNPPRPPVRDALLKVGLDFRGPRLQITPVTGPTGRLPTPQNIFAGAEKWEPKRY